MSLARAVTELGWPDEGSIMAPPGAGPAVTAELARKKVGQPLRDLEGAQDARLGVLSADPTANGTDAPIALVCDFGHDVPDTTVSELHRLAWNFCRTPLLLTVDTGRLRAFSCCEPPAPPQTIQYIPAELTEVSYDFSVPRDSASSLADEARHSLHWLELVTGQLFKKNEQRFTNANRADVLLLSNLQHVRRELYGNGLDYDIIHDLLARVIFIQFLFDRRDSDGQTALNTNYLARLHDSGILSKSYGTFSELLANHTDCYNLFWYLDNRFNGDLFPGSDDASLERSVARNVESRLVRPRHLALLSHFVSGRMELRSGQLSLWPNYSFDIIPLEFISSIYEAFVAKKTGTVYTPGHLVDFVLDGVLPWNSKEWDLKVLDPACGSGIFLVKAYQRLIHRWKLAHPNQRIGSNVLRSLLVRNLFGVDDDAHAVRTASFSLYLAMCDEIDPRHYWTQVKFPYLRNRSLLAQDFFDEQGGGPQTGNRENHYDLVVGNAPWGRNTVTPAAESWASKHEWPISYGDIGPLFLAKAALTVEEEGQVSLIQPGSTLLFNNSSNAVETRRRVFGEFSVTEVVNLSALRFRLFNRSIGPAILVTVKPGRGDREAIQYVCPKPERYSGSDEYRIRIDQYDVHEVYPDEAVNSAIVWSALIWGGRRDVALLDRLSALPTMGKYRREGVINSRQGIIRGEHQVAQPELLGRRILEQPDFPKDVFLTLSPDTLERNKDPNTHARDSTDFSAFQPAQLLVKMSWTMEEGRFRAVTVSPPTESVICTRHFMSIRASKEDQAMLDLACMAYNSRVAMYYLLLGSGRFANYRPEPYVTELLEVPIPKTREGRRIGDLRSRDELDRAVEEMYELKEAERVLMEDALEFALADYKGDSSSPGRKSAELVGHDGESLRDYCRWFLRVLRAGFGRERQVAATVYAPESGQRLPVRMIAFHFGITREQDVCYEIIGAGELAEQLRRVDRILNGEEEGGISFRRMARVFDVWSIEGRSVPTVLMVKPDEARYWTRSIAMRDADEVSGEIMHRVQKPTDQPRSQDT